MENEKIEAGVQKGFSIKLRLSKPLDNLLSGGIEAGALTNFCGPPGCGKTNICMLAAINAVNSGKKVIYIDTEGGFSFERFSQLAGENTDKILDRIMFLEPRTFKEQEETIKKCRSLVTNDEFGLVVLDSSVALYRLEYAETDDVMKANKQLGIHLSILSAIAREFKIPAIITTHVYKKNDSELLDVIGGDAMKYWCKSIILIEKTGETSVRSATIVKHRSMPEGKSVTFLLTDSGIEPVEKKFGIF
ncbi:MAG: DNA repair and recombination protein RadB [Candidatus Aenigmarchaeota archaeon]|nr:DNA repair and recombination protein RadB [Candidatus Aenigmarchaeota archaeon]